MTELRHCRLEVRDHVALVTLCRPQVLNALHPPAHRELDAVFDRVRDDSDVRVVIVTGSGERAFCVGTDLKALAGSKPEGAKVIVLTNYTIPQFRDRSVALGADFFFDKSREYYRVKSVLEDLAATREGHRAH